MCQCTRSATLCQCTRSATFLQTALKLNIVQNIPRWKSECFLPLSSFSVTQRVIQEIRCVPFSCCFININHRIFLLSNGCVTILVIVFSKGNRIRSTQILFTFVKIRAGFEKKKPDLNFNDLILIRKTLISLFNMPFP